jgi:hypothetical protein
MDTEQSVNLALIYNPFDVSDIVREELLYQDGKTLDHYLVGLPTECDWKVGLNTIPVDAKDWPTTEVEAEDVITIIAIPHGGSGGKDILRLVALIAVVVVAAIALPAIGLTGAALAAGMAVAAAVGGFLINLLIPPAALKNKSKDDGQSYGYDGAKNTAKEGTPIPVIYGQFRVAGNFIDLFTENVGDDQYMYGRVVLSDGEIDSVVGNPEINEQDITNYKDVQWGYTHGTTSESVNTLFNGSKQQFLKEDLLSTSFTNYDTTGNVDGFEIDFVFPQGLADINTKTGAKTARSVTVEIQYAPFGTTNWTNPGTTGSVTSGYRLFTGVSPTGTNFRVLAQGTSTTGLFGTATYNVEYRLNGVGSWTTFHTYNDTSQNFSTYPTLGGNPFTRFDTFDNHLADDYTVSVGYPQRFVDIVLPSGQYEFRVTGSGNMLNATVLPPNVTPGSGGVSATTQVTYTDSRTKTLRKTYKSPTLPRARYSIRFRRTVNSDPSHPDWIDALNCTGVTEVNHSNVTQKNVATGWFVAKMTDQLSGIPNITWLTKGVKVDIYDNNGIVTVNQWSDNPADIALDMLISDKRGALRNKINIDFPSFVQWRNYCNTEGLKFNGVFDSMTTLWDALIDVFKVGRAFPVRSGTKLSVAVDKPSNPVMLFGPGNIFKDSFEITYLGLQDRANEFEASYYDVNDRNKKKTIRIVDPTAAQSGQIPKTVQYELFGVDNFTQAQKEVWYQLYNNRLARRVLTFDAPIESIGLTLGDVAYVQHDMVDWGKSGRLAAVTNSSQVTLDQNVTIVGGNTYSLLINHTQVSKATCNISLVAGTTYNLTGLSSTSNPTDTLKRIQTNTGKEAEILDFTYTGGSNATITLSNTVTGTTATIWDVDVIEERTVSTSAGTTKVINVSTPFSITPTIYSNFMFGINTIVKKPYRLRAISGEGFDRRTLTFVEYNSYIYSAPETTIPSPPINPTVFPSHVTNVTLSIDPFRFGGIVIGHLSWSSNSILNYGGVDIYQSINGSAFTFLQTVQNGNDVTLFLPAGVDVQLKVNAFNTSRMRANVSTAPIANKTIRVATSSLVAPTALTWTLDKVNLFAQGK